MFQKTGGLFCIAFVLATTVLTAPAKVHAVLIAFDPFSNYAAGDLTPQNPPVAGFSGAWKDGQTATGTWVRSASNTSLSSPSPLTTSGSHAAFNAGAGTGTQIRRVFRSLDAYSAPMAGTPTYWFSGLLALDRVDNAGSVLVGFTSQGNVADNNDAQFFDTASDRQIQGLLWGFEGNGSGTDLVIRYRDQSAGNLPTTVTLLSNVTVNQGHFLVAKLEKDISGGLDRLTVWLDPLSLGSEGALGTPTFVDSSTFSLFQDTAISRLTMAEQNFASIARFDEFHFGTTLADVAPVPEPATAALGALALMGLARRRRSVG